MIWLRHHRKAAVITDCLATAGATWQREGTLQGLGREKSPEAFVPIIPISDEYGGST